MSEPTEVAKKDAWLLGSLALLQQIREAILASRGPVAQQSWMFSRIFETPEENPMLPVVDRFTTIVAEIQCYEDALQRAFPELARQRAPDRGPS